jgi:hypothetical protein
MYSVAVHVELDVSTISKHTCNVKYLNVLLLSKVVVVTVCTVQCGAYRHTNISTLWLQYSMVALHCNASSHNTVTKCVSKARHKETLMTNYSLIEHTRSACCFIMLTMRRVPLHTWYIYLHVAHILRTIPTIYYIAIECTCTA